MANAEPEKTKEQEVIKAEDLEILMQTEYNVLMAKISMYPNLPQREMQLARTNLEQSFLWLRCAISKLSAEQPEG